MLPDRVSNPGPLTYESGALPIALRGPAWTLEYALYRTVKIKGKLLELRKVISGSASLVVLT